MTMRARFLAAIGLFCGVSLAAQPVRLVAPANDSVLRGDHFATIAWSADPTLEAEEWEAFLSVDGGRYYSVRITPHLDLGVRSFEFLVPNIASDDVRLLMRVGNERVESIIEFPARFSIRPSRSTVVGRRLSASIGPEGARPGEAVVVEWATGARDGGNLQFAHARSGGPALRARIRGIAVSAEIALARDEVRAARVDVVLDERPVTFDDHTQPAFILERDVLRLITRLNV